MAERPDDQKLRRATAVLLAGVAVASAAVGAFASGPVALFGAFGASYSGLWLLYRLVSKERARTWLAQAILLHVSMGFVLALFELPVLLGMVDYRLIFHPPIAPMHDPKNVLDEELLFRRRGPVDLKGVADGGDFGFLFHTEAQEKIPFDAHFDEDGFRNPDRPRSADVVFVGDSFTEALLVPTEDVVSSRVAKDLGLTTANYGMMTYGPYQELAVVRRYALPLKPKAVVWLFFEGNDLGDVTYFDWATKDLHGLHERYHGFVHRSFSMNLPRTLYHMSRAFKPSGEPRAATLASQDTRLYFLHPPKSPATKKNAKALETFERLIAEAHEETKEAGVQLIFAFIPVKFRVYHDLVSFGPSTDLAEWTLTDVPERVERIVRATSPDIAYVDLLEPLRASAKAGEHPYYRVDSHWNATGHGVAARAIEAALRAAGSSTVAEGRGD